MTLPLAHLGHYLWILYLLPILIVVGGILRSILLERRRDPVASSGPSGKSSADSASENRARRGRRQAE